MKILVFAASLRKDSFNRKLAKAAAETLAAMNGVSVDAADFREFEMPMYDGDLEDRDGIPAGGKEFISRLASADAVVISTPEYNGSIPGTLKNAIDWASRPDPHPFKQKPILLMGATTGGLGATQGLWTTRAPLEKLGAYVFPAMFGLSNSDTAFESNGSFKDSKNRARLDGVLRSYVEFVQKLKK